MCSNKRIDVSLQNSNETSVGMTDQIANHGSLCNQMRLIGFKHYTKFVIMFNDCFDDKIICQCVVIFHNLRFEY